MMLQRFFDAVLSSAPSGKQQLEKATPTAVGDKIIFAALEFATNMDLLHIQKVVCRIMNVICGYTPAVPGSPVLSPVAFPPVKQPIFQVVALMPVFFSS